MIVFVTSLPSAYRESIASPPTGRVALAIGWGEQPHDRERAWRQGDYGVGGTISRAEG
ncbi:hypothetical protein MVI01_50460 [Myxococcus virescens]|uniref:Uncharacterized protein n=1 Tax=Myxococcus virescens TaxID=83456 RepID=A0A511HI65_9BACT|nr:hypothetical protein MVI01_50460 [Myxococcus virescens]